MQQSLVKVFHKTAVEAHEAFPQELGKLVVFLTPSSDTPVYVSPDIADQLTKSTAAIKEVVKDLANELHNHDMAGLAQRNYNMAGTPVDVIAANESSVGAFSSSYTEEMQLIYNLDHEIGHHIVKNGYPSSNVSKQLAESAADAYATLRHIQRFGKNTEFAECCGGIGASRIVLFSDTEHYTTDTIQRVIQLSEGMDISRLSLRETAGLAKKVAAESRINYKTLRKISNAFLPVQGIYKKTQNRDYTSLCREIVSVMKKYQQDPDIFKAGERFLNYPQTKEFIQEMAKTDPLMKAVLDFMGRPAMKASKKLAYSFHN